MKTLRESKPILEAEARHVACLHCGMDLDVSGFNPLDILECLQCKNSFELLRQFGEWKIADAYHPGSIFTAENAQRGKRAVLRFLTSQEWNRPEAFRSFEKEAQSLCERLPSEKVVDCHLEQNHGFIALVVELKPGSLGGEVLTALEVPDAKAILDETHVSAEIMACPHCGKLLKNEELPHLCEPLSGESLSVPDFALLDTLQPPLPVAACPRCNQEMDVSGFQPLDSIECASCHASSELLRHFSGFKLSKRMEGEWQNSVYLATDLSSKGRALMVVMSPGMRMREDRNLVFAAEAGDIHARLNTMHWSRQCSVDQFQGFVYMAVSLDPTLVEEEILSAFEPPAASDTPSLELLQQPRVAACPKCQALMDVSVFNPLDGVICGGCGVHFELFRNFDHYRIDYRLSEGGTSNVYLAEDLRLKRQVALKILSSEEMKKNPEAAAHFAREYELTRALKHPNIVEVYEGGQFHGYSFISMGLVEGVSLEEILSRIQQNADHERKQIESSQWTSASSAYDLIWPDSNQGSERNKPGVPELVCLEIMLQAAAGLGAAHQAGLIHGDVKPENIILTYKGIVKVLDFGLVQFADVQQSFEEGKEDAIFGTPIYLPPERVRGEPEDFRSDFYSLGATLYHLLRGIAPFRAKSPDEIAKMHVNAPVIKFKAFVPTASDVTCRIVEKSMKKSVSERYSSHIEFIADLTLARRLLVQAMRDQPEKGQALLKSFMKIFSSHSKKTTLWERAATTAVHTYKYATMAITSRLKKTDR